MTTYPADDAASVMAHYRAPLADARRYEYCDKASAAEGVPAFQVYVEIRGSVDSVHGHLHAARRAHADDQAYTVVEVMASTYAAAGVLHPWLASAIDQWQHALGLSYLESATLSIPRSKSEGDTRA